MKQGITLKELKDMEWELWKLNSRLRNLLLQPTPRPSTKLFDWVGYYKNKELNL
jgi:hypothetical protein